MPNRLADTSSPYLRQHAENPVDWYPWGDEAFTQARRRDCPVLVSIGYSACHWCHVMAHESFDDREIAAYMNAHFVNVKVDREERPDVDTIYMEAVQMLTGHGGWPLNVFLTPDLRPFFGGTYWPPTPRHGMPSWPQVLGAIAEAWKNDRARVVTQADTIVGYLATAQQSAPSDDTLDEAVLDRATQIMVRQVDRVNGGFGGAPKFPQAMNLEFLLRGRARSGNLESLEMVELTLQRMAEGGIYDHLGGGFHRYTVDATWTVPHFEKMLYDNALLAHLYVQAWQATQLPLYRAVAEGTLDYVLRDMTSDEGGFYSAEDADSEGVEGKFYVWTSEEIRRSLGEDEAAIFEQRYGVTARGNFEGKNILEISRSVPELARINGLSEPQVEGILADARRTLLNVRSRRIRPGRDDKILTAWNALTARALALAGRVFQRTDYLDAGCRNARFLLDRLRIDGRLRHEYAADEAQIDAFLDDYAFLLDALVTLYETAFDLSWLQSARDIADSLLSLFSDEDRGGFYDTAMDADAALPVRPKSLFDNAVPSGNSAAAYALLRLARLTGHDRYVRAALGPLRLTRAAMDRQPTALGRMLAALDFHLAPPQEAAIVGDLDDPRTQDLVTALYTRYRPNTVVAVASPTDREHAAQHVPLLAGRDPIDSLPTAFVCENYSCRLPVTDPATLFDQLAASGV